MRASYAVGVDVGGTQIAAGLVERKGRMVKDAKKLTPRDSAFGIIDAVIEVIEEVTAGVQGSEVAGIGVGLPAQIDFLKQSVEFCTNLPLGGVDVRSLIMSRTKCELTIDNDGNLAAFGEARYGAAQSARDFLMLTLGTGVGGGLFLDGQPFRGSRGLGGEVGHIVVDLDGPPCPCGGTGHLESYVSRHYLAEQGRRAAEQYKGRGIIEAAGGDPENITAEEVLKAARAGDEVAREILMDFGYVLGRAMVGFVNIFNPQMIVVGGGIQAQAPFVVDRAVEVMQGEALAGRRDVKVVPAVLGNDAGILGAAALAFDEYDSREGLHR